MSTHEQITIVALIALPEESRVFQDVFECVADHTSDTQVCIEHKSGVPNVRLISVVAEQMGAQSARESAEYSINKFNPDLIIVIGIGGGISSDVSIGDVCVSNDIYDLHHNNKVSVVDGKEDISFSPEVHNVHADLVASFSFLLSHPTLRDPYDNWCQEMASSANSTPHNESDELPKIHIAPIACGPVSASKKFNEKLKSLHRKVAAIETESGGVFNAISRKNIPAIALRGISDMANEDKTNFEKITKGAAREKAMKNASELLAVQLKNNWFIDVAKRYFYIRHCPKQGDFEQLFKSQKPQTSPIAELESEIKEHLTDVCPDIRSRPEGFYLPIPRASRIFYEDDLSSGELDTPEDIVKCIEDHNRIIVKMPRSFPTQALGWTLAHSLIRQQIDGKPILPFVIEGRNIRPPKSGLQKAIPPNLQDAIKRSEYTNVYIIEEPNFESRSQMKFLNSQIAEVDDKILILTRAEDNVTAVDSFIRKNSLIEHQLTPVSFSETAFYLERTFDMPSHEAEAIAIKLDSTFRNFQLDAHPTYFAGLHEETLVALINANKRAELIQLAVAGLLLLIVVTDNTQTSLSRTTRERFLKHLVLTMALEGDMDEKALAKTTKGFLKEHKFNISHTEFLSPFFEAGLLYKNGGKTRFTHHYLESYLLAQSLKDDPKTAKDYFDPNKEFFNFYAFDLYCEIGPDEDVMYAIIKYVNDSYEGASDTYKDDHIYLKTEDSVISVSSTAQVKNFALRLSKSVKKMTDKNANNNIRSEKQRLLDTRDQVQSKMKKREIRNDEQLPEEIKTEFEILDRLSRSFTLCIIAVGSGAESLNGNLKVNISKLILKVSDKFTDIWTRNRLRLDFKSTKEELLADDVIREFMKKSGIDDSKFKSVKSDWEFFLSEVEVDALSEPLRRIIGAIGASACAKVLAPILESIEAETPIEKIIKACWYLDVNPEVGGRVTKNALSEYKGSSLLRLVLARHFLSRLYWHHYNTSGASHFVNSTQRALAPLGLKPSKKGVDHAKKGVG